MNRKITLPKAARMMADHTGLAIRQCEDFMKSLTDIVSETLADGESIKVKGLGTFRIVDVESRRSVDVSTGRPTEIAGHTKVVFIPSKEMAAEVNSPFEFFEAVELDDNVNEDELEALEDIEGAELPETLVIAGKSVIEENMEPLSSNRTSLEKTSVKNDSSETVLGDGSDTTEINASPDSDSESVKRADVVTEVEDSVSYAEERSDEPDNRESSSEEETPDKENNDSAMRKLHRKKNHDDDNDYMSHEEYIALREKHAKSKFGRGLIIGMVICLIAVAFGMGVGSLMLWNKFSVPEEIKILEEETIVPEPGDTQDTKNQINAATEETDAGKISVSGNYAVEGISEDIPTSPSDKSQKTAQKADPVYDTIGKTRYLTTMAKDHYGNFNLWPYIYEENKAILGHPDRIKPGTRVVIPPLSKYGISNNPADIEKAKKLGVEIYNRYK